MANNLSAPKRMSSLDVVKCMAAFFVVCIHLGSGPLAPITRTAVPLFFIISGYYYPQLIARGCFWRHMRKILILTAWATAFYAVIRLRHDYYDGTMNEWIQAHSTGKSILTTIFYGRGIFSWHLWFLYAMIYDLLLLRLAERWRFYPYLKYFVPFLLLAFMYLGQEPAPWELPSWLFFGLPCMVLGRLIAEGKDKGFRFLADNRRGYRYALIFVALSYVELLLFRCLTDSNGFRGLYAFTIPLALAFFYIALQHPGFNEGGIWALIGRKYSSYIYVFHIFAMNVYSRFVIHDTFLQRCIAAIVVFLLSLIISVLFKWLCGVLSRKRT